MSEEQIKLEAQAQIDAHKKKLQFLTNPLWERIDKTVNKALTNALNYLDEPKKSRKWTPLVAIGPKTQLTKKIVEKVTSNKDYPPIPLFADNEVLRSQMKIREKSPLFKVVASAIGQKYQYLKAELAEAIEQEKSKTFCGINDFPLRIESTDEELPEEKEVV